MLFNSFEFLVFFPIVSLGYFLLRKNARVWWLLLASCYFYMAFVPVYILILVVTILIDYVAGIFIEGAEGKRRKAFLVMSIVANVGMLVFFKYFNFVNANLGALAENVFHAKWPVSALSIVLPIGLSFHTFQAMSYTIEVYRGNQAAERNFGVYALYVLFYPQLVAGPIERPQNLLHQFHAEHSFNFDDACVGLRYMLWGFFKKVVIADRLSMVVDHVYDDPHAFKGPALALATAFFAFQIYADFSGYSDIAIGAARFMGIRLMTNFKQPYMSQSIAEFWKRWHVSLSTWFRDYFYISLGGNRVSQPRVYMNLFLTFLVSGLWHGANWTFLIWGGLNGVYLIAALVFAPMKVKISETLGLARMPRFNALLQTLITFVLICITWVFFRARTVSEGFYIVRNFVSGLRPSSLAALSSERTDIILGLAGIGILLTADWFVEKGVVERIGERPTWQRWMVYYAALFAILAMGRFGLQQFIYFQF